jgi:hypothetical protein
LLCFMLSPHVRNAPKNGAPCTTTQPVR